MGFEDLGVGGVNLHIYIFEMFVLFCSCHRTCICSSDSESLRNALQTFLFLPASVKTLNTHENTTL